MRQTGRAGRRVVGVERDHVEAALRLSFVTNERQLSKALLKRCSDR